MFCVIFLLLQKNQQVGSPTRTKKKLLSYITKVASISSKVAQKKFVETYPYVIYF